MREILRAFGKHEADILIGTQMIREGTLIFRALLWSASWRQIYRCMSAITGRRSGHFSC